MCFSKYNDQNITKALLKLNRDEKMSPKLYLESQNNSGWRDIRTPFVQPSAQSRVSCEGRPACSGLYPVWPWVSPRTETKQPLWETCSAVWLLSELKSFSFYPVWTPLVSVYACCLSFSPTHAREEPGSILLLTYLLVWASCRPMLPKQFLLRAEQPWSLGLSSQDKCSSSWPAWGSPADLTSVSWHLSCIGGPKTGRSK